MQWGLGIGCIFAISMMILSVILLINEAYRFLTCESPPPAPPVTPNPSWLGKASKTAASSTLSVSLGSSAPPASTTPPIHPSPIHPPRIRSPPTRPPPSEITNPKSVSHGHDSREADTPNPCGHPSQPTAGYSHYAGLHLIPSLTRVDVDGSSRPLPEHMDSYIRETICLQHICEEYFKSLRLDGAYFRKYINCYCIKHYSDRETTLKKSGGYDHTIPRGWVRFQLRTDKLHSRQNGIFQDWATSYYGTSAEKLNTILRNSFIPISGDHLLDGQTFSDHIQDGSFCYTSPSINYASNALFSPMRTFKSNKGESYHVQVVLQCKQKPRSFERQCSRFEISDPIPAAKIEWKSDNRSTIVPFGLLVRMAK